MPDTDTLTTTRPKIAVGDKVRLKPVQESAYRPQTLLDYFRGKNLAEADAVFTVTYIWPGEKDTMVDFAELYTKGGYYLRRFELVPADVDTQSIPVQSDAPPSSSQLLVAVEDAVDALVAAAKAEARAELLAELGAFVASKA